MKTAEKLYLTASEVAEIMGVSLSVAYKMVRIMNNELREQKFLTISGKIPAKYFATKYFGFEA